MDNMNEQQNNLNNDLETEMSTPIENKPDIMQPTIANNKTADVLEEEIARFKKINTRNNIIIIALVVLLIFMIFFLGFSFIF